MRNTIRIFTALLISATLILESGCASHKKLPDACYAKPAAGNCKAAFERYYYNPETKKCEVFIWGGCAGNVPFETLEECKKKCGCK